MGVSKWVPIRRLGVLIPARQSCKPINPKIHWKPSCNKSTYPRSLLSGFFSLSVGISADKNNVGARVTTVWIWDYVSRLDK